nr:DNA-processing protein DprA [Geodermatophilaceae bacterium]
MRPVDADGPGDDNAERWSRAWLSRAVEPGDAATFALVRLLGAAEAVRLIRARRAPPSVMAAVGSRWEDDLAGRDLEEAARRGIRLVVPSDPEWPGDALHPMELALERGVPGLAPPLSLWARGRAQLADAVGRAVAIVGSRAATPYGEHVAGELAYGLADAGWTVVSGGALGIDGSAHRAALAAAGTTVAVLAGGLDRAYPASHAGLFERITADGLLVGEWPPGCAPHRHRFLIRNRLVAGLSAGTVVVE